MRLIKHGERERDTTSQTQMPTAIELCAYCVRELSQGLHIECSLMLHHAQLRAVRQVSNPRQAFANLFKSNDLELTSANGAIEGGNK